MLSSSPLRLVHIAESIFFQYSACRSPCFPISFQGVVVSGAVEIPLSPARGRPCCCFRLVHIAENHLLSRCCSPPRAVGILSRPLSGARSVRAAVRIAKPRFFFSTFCMLGLGFSLWSQYILLFTTQLSRCQYSSCWESIRTALRSSAWLPAIPPCRVEVCCGAPKDAVSFVP